MGATQLQRRLLCVCSMCVAIGFVGFFYIKDESRTSTLQEDFFGDTSVSDTNNSSPLFQWISEQKARDEKEAELFQTMANRVGVVVASGPENYYANRELAISHSWGLLQQTPLLGQGVKKGQFARLQHLLFERDWRGNWYKQVETAREWAEKQPQSDKQPIEWVLFVLPDVFVNVANLFRFIHEIELNDIDLNRTEPRVYGRTVETDDIVGFSKIDRPVNLTSLVAGILMNMAAARIIARDHPGVVNDVNLFRSIFNDDVRLGYFLSLFGSMRITSSPLFGVTSPLCKEAQGVPPTEKTTGDTRQRWVRGITLNSIDMWNMIVLAGEDPQSRLACSVKLNPVNTHDLLFATIVGGSTLPLFRAGFFNMTLEHNLRLLVTTNLPKSTFSTSDYPNIDWYIDPVAGDSWDIGQRHFGYLIKRACSYVSDHTEVKWLVYGDTDTAFNVPALLERLSLYDPFQPVVIGEYNDGSYPHGGAGMIMSAVGLLRMEGCQFHQNLDLALGGCARAKGVRFVHDGGLHWIPISHSSGYGQVPPDLAQLPPLSEHRAILEHRNASYALFKEKNAAYAACSNWQRMHLSELSELNKNRNC
jgi:hypothetical protein